MKIVKIVGIGVLCLFGSAAMAETCKVEIEGNDAMQFNKSEIAIGANCSSVELTLKHTGSLPKGTMGHAVVITRSADFQAVANAGVGAGVDNNHVPPGDDRVIANTKLVGGGETTTVTFSTDKLEAGGDYTFFCPFPGHNAIMKGKLVFG